MSVSLLEDELYSLSFDTIEDDNDHAPWFSLIQNLSRSKLEELRKSFQETEHDKVGFIDVICSLYGNSKYSLQSALLFEEVSRTSSKTSIGWNDLLDFLVKNLCPKRVNPVILSLRKIEDVPHVKRETVVKIVLIESRCYFCYAMISKHGKIGLYDGNLDFLTSYHAIMTEEDVTRSEEERRRRNRWITDAIYCEDVQMFLVTNSARTLTIYEASGLRHVPYWLIISLPNIAQCLAYKSATSCSDDVCTLYLGCFNGDLMEFKFVQPQSGLLRRKHVDKISMFYWNELPKEGSHVKVKVTRKLHEDTINRIEYQRYDNSILTCSNDPDNSVIKKYISHVKSPYVYKMHWGCKCFAISDSLKLLVTGSLDGSIRLWNPVIVSKPVSSLSGHYSGIVDLVVMEKQEMLLSFSEDGVLKLWNLTEHKCLQTMKLKFPSYSVHGKTIEFASEAFRAGPKRLKGLDQKKNKQNVCFSMDDVSERSENGGARDEKDPPTRWERSNVLVSCCNHLAVIKTSFMDPEIEDGLEMPVLPPPPLQNSVLIPASWKIQDVSETVGEPVDETNETSKSSLEDIDFIMKKQLLDSDGSRSDINYKIAILESKKQKMRSHVANGAPYLVLDLFEIEDLKLPEHLPIPDIPKIQKLVDKTKRLLQDAARRDQVFSEPSTSRSRSSRSSYAEL